MDSQQVLKIVEDLFGDWTGPVRPEIQVGERGASIDHIPHESTQTQIGIAYESVPYSHPQYFEAWGAVSVLSGGSSSRLFTEVREKRGLCYSVYATLHSLKQEELGSVLRREYRGTGAINIGCDIARDSTAVRGDR